ncbi:MAG: polysaccharide deacetylase family protein [Crocinitomicaceae bacterium]|nr:polysaccharide deacetylase family protein [Crocinitomicaceae bacterium]
MKFFKTPRFFKWIFPKRLWGFSMNENVVYLTFDDGPTEELTTWILDLLKEKEVKATFFCVGANAKKFPALMKRTINDGHAIGNHTMYHDKGTKISKKEYLESVHEARKLIDSDLFRPPYGRLPMTHAKVIAKEFQIVMWSWLSYDYDITIPIERILEKSSLINKGDVLVLHDNKKTVNRTKELLPALIDSLKERGFTFSTISV